MKTKNEANVYEFICAVTGEKVKTNPKQFFETAQRYGVIDEVLKKSYVSREGRRAIRALGLTAEQVTKIYGVDIAVSSKLKHLAIAPVSENISVEIPADAIDTPIVEAAIHADAPATLEVPLEETATIAV